MLLKLVKHRISIQFHFYYHTPKMVLCHKKMSMFDDAIFKNCEDFIKIWIQHKIGIEIRGNYHCAMKRKWSDIRTGLLILLEILLAHHLTTKRVSDMQISYKEILFLLSIPDWFLKLTNSILLYHQILNLIIWI